jgi:hypothetical protein
MPYFWGKKRVIAQDVHSARLSEEETSFCSPILRTHLALPLFTSLCFKNTF